jgi:helix-turn-helix resolvase-like protein
MGHSIRFGQQQWWHSRAACPIASPLGGSGRLITRLDTPPFSPRHHPDSGIALGKVGGRRRSLSQKDIGLVKKLYADKSTSIADICRSFKISRWTLQRYIKGK